MQLASRVQPLSGIDLRLSKLQRIVMLEEHQSVAGEGILEKVTGSHA